MPEIIFDSPRVFLLVSYPNSAMPDTLVADYIFPIAGKPDLLRTQNRLRFPMAIIEEPLRSNLSF